jgi:hypothetical protein
MAEARVWRTAEIENNETGSEGHMSVPQTDRRRRRRRGSGQGKLAEKTRGLTSLDLYTDIRNQGRTKGEEPGK